MANYKLGHALWLATKVAATKEALVAHMEPSKLYNETDLIALLRCYNTDLTNNEFTEVGAALLAEGVIEAVP